MRKVALVLLGALALSGSAQTYNGNITIQPETAGYACGAAYDQCYGLPMTFDNVPQLDGTVKDVAESVWFEYYGGRGYGANFAVYPKDSLNLDNQNPNQMAYFVTGIPTIITDGQPHNLPTQAIQGIDSQGRSYLLTQNLTYYTHFASGRGGGWKWIVTGGTVSITYNGSIQSRPSSSFNKLSTTSNLATPQGGNTLEQPAGMICTSFRIVLYNPFTNGFLEWGYCSNADLGWYSTVTWWWSNGDGPISDGS